jgi:EmrB/QacA subfamily drug resistance transporter
MIVLLLGVVTAMLNTSITNVALPTIAADLNATGLQIHWIGDGYTITLTSFVLIAGAIGDRYGRKLMFLLGAALMLPTSLLSATSQDANQLILWRAIAGISMAMLFPTTLSFITSIFREPKERIRAIGLWTGVAGGAAAIAPPIAGALVQYFHWGSVFLISAPAAAILLIAGWFILPNIRDPHAHPVDWIGGVLTIVLVGGLMVAIIEFPVSGFDRFVLISLGISAIAFGLFIVRQLRARYPLLDLTVFRVAAFSVACVTIALLFFGMSGILYLGAQYLQSVLGYEPLQAGLAVLPVALLAMVTAPAAARLVERFGGKLIVATGLALAALGFATGFLWGVDTPYWVLFISYALIGAGVGLAATPSTNAIMSTLPEEKAGVGSAMNDVTRDFGTAFGIAVNGSLAAITYSTLFERVFATLPPEQRAQVSADTARTVSGSLNGALAVAQTLPPQQAEALVTFSREAFVRGQGIALTASIFAVLICLAIVLWKFPGRE